MAANHLVEKRVLPVMDLLGVFSALVQDEEIKKVRVGTEFSPSLNAHRFDQTFDRRAVILSPPQKLVVVRIVAPADLLLVGKHPRHPLPSEAGVQVEQHVKRVTVVIGMTVSLVRAEVGFFQESDAVREDIL